jgi:hypothetical protein
MWAPTKLNDGTIEQYGFGWSIDSVNGKLILEHNGSWQGFECTIKRYPEQKIAVVAFANLKRASTYKISTKILRLYQPELSINSLKTIKDSEPGITKLVNEFINNVAEKKLRTDQFTAALAVEIMDSTTQARGSEYVNSKGKFLKSELISRKELGETREYRYRILFSKEVLGLMIQFNKENKIVDLQMLE